MWNLWKSKKQPESAYPFVDAPDTACIVCRHITEDNDAILFVSHDEDDGMWQFLCGGSHDTDEARLVSLGWVAAHDPTVGALKDMPAGCYAERESADAEWHIYRAE